MTPQQAEQVAKQLQRAVDAKVKARQEAERNAVFTQIGKYFSIALKPLMEAVDEMKRIGANLGILSSKLNSLEIPKPEINVDLSTLRLPTPNVTVKPIVDIPNFKMPSEMDIKGWIGLMGYDRGLLTNPLPVQLRDAEGNPLKLFENLTQLVNGGGGGGFRHVVVDRMPDISVSVSAGSDSSVSLVNADGAYYNSDNPLPVTMTASGSSSVSLVNADGSYYNSDNPLPVTFPASVATQPVIQVSGAVDSVNILQVGGNAVVVGTGYQDNALRVVHATDAVASVNIVSPNALDVKQVSGAVYSVAIIASGVEIGAVASGLDTNLKAINGLTSGFGSGVVNSGTLRVVHATDAIASVNVVSSATITVTGSLTSSVVVGPIAADVADDGNAPIQIGGIARTANPTAVAAGDVVKASMDDIGRQIIRPVQVRDLLATAYASITSGSETTLVTAAAGTYLDLLYVMGTNNSDAAVTVDIRAVSAGNIMTSIRIPANGTAGVSLPVPIPQDATGNAWTADIPDITGTTVTISALFSKEV